MNFIRLHEIIKKPHGHAYSNTIDVNCIQICCIKACDIGFFETIKKEVLAITKNILPTDLQPTVISLSNGKEIIVAESVDYIQTLIK